MHRKRRGSVVSDAAEDMAQDALGLAASLRQTGRCVMRMGHIVLDLEHQLLAGTGEQPPGIDSMQSLQSLDFLKQTADDLAALLERLADAVPPDMSVSQDNILGPMKLQELRDMIGDTRGMTPPFDVPKSDKQVELF